MSSYQPFLALEDVRWVQHLPPARRRRVLESLALLNGRSDMDARPEGKDEIGRLIWSRVHRGVSLVFWIDHAERRVMIVEIGFVGR